MVQSSVMSATQFIVRIALAIRELLSKKPPEMRRVPSPPETPTPSWTVGDHGFIEYRGVQTALKPVLPAPPETMYVEHVKEGVRAYMIWTDVVSPNYFNDLRAMLGQQQEKRGEASWLK